MFLTGDLWPKMFFPDESSDFDTVSAAATSSLEDDIAPLPEEIPLRGCKRRGTQDPESAHISIEKRTKE